MNHAKTPKLGAILQFAIPSFFGLGLFVIPIPKGETFSIPIALLANRFSSLVEGYQEDLILMVIALSAGVTFFTSIKKPDSILKTPYLKQLFDIHYFWILIRFLGMVFAGCLYFRIGPEAVLSDKTGRMVYAELLPILFSVFLLAGFFLPLLLDFGLLEFFGLLLSRIMRPVFTLPGRSAIDCLASWLGDGTVGILLTNKQYEEGFYTAREAAVISTTFSVVSITFSFVVLKQVRLEHLVLPYYATIAVSGLVAAIVCPRLPPLSRKPDTYISKRSETLAQKNDEITDLRPTNRFQEAIDIATKRALAHKGPRFFIESGLKNVLEMWLGVIPVVLSIGTVALIIAEYTSVFEWLSWPFVPILKMLAIPEAEEAAQSVVVGFADQFLPSILASSIVSEKTRFVIAALSVTQLIFMSEVGSLLLGLRIPLKFFELVAIFLIRTIVTLPIIALSAHLIFS